MILKLDYDFCNRRQALKRFRDGLISIRRVYESKRTYYPLILVDQVWKTKKGVHIILQFYDGEFYLLKTLKERRMALIIFQDILDSDKTRSGFDLLRTMRSETDVNLMFNYKNKHQCIKWDTSEWNNIVLEVFTNDRSVNKSDLRFI